MIVQLESGRPKPSFRQRNRMLPILSFPWSTDRGCRRRRFIDAVDARSNFGDSASKIDCIGLADVLDIRDNGGLRVARWNVGGQPRGRRRNGRRSHVSAAGGRYGHWRHAAAPGRQAGDGRVDRDDRYAARSRTSLSAFHGRAGRPRDDVQANDVAQDVTRPRKTRSRISPSSIRR